MDSKSAVVNEPCPLPSRCRSRDRSAAEGRAISGPAVLPMLTQCSEARGLVRRRPDEDDGRGVRVELTDAGRAASAQFTQEMTAWVDALVAGLGARARDRLTRLAWQLLGHARADA